MSMFFGTTGRFTAGFLILLVLLAGSVAWAQEEQPEDGCTLPLAVPAASEIQIELQPSGRGPGLLLTWPQPDDAASTCYSLIDTAGIGVDIEAGGVYIDAFDRTLEFEFTASGVVGDQTKDRFTCSWNNANSSRTGTIGGDINLSNTGGMWIRDDLGIWTQRNAGFPAYLPYTNLVDIAATNDGAMVAILSAGAKAENDPIGVYRLSDEGSWVEVGAETFGDSRSLTTLAMDPADANRFAIGSRKDGLFVTNDGGATFTQWTTNLFPDAESYPEGFLVSAVLWTDTRLYVSVRYLGTVVSNDGGASFTLLENLVVPDGNGGTQVPYVRSLLEDPADADRILVGLTSNGIYESLDAGSTWTALDGNYQLLDDGDASDDPEADAAKTVLAMSLDPGDGNIILMGTLAQGLWLTTDGGANWIEADTPFIDEALFVTKPQVWSIVRRGGELLTSADGFALMESVDGGATWTELADQPVNRKSHRLLSVEEGILRPSLSGGIYVPGTVLRVSDTLDKRRTDAEYADLDLGLTLAFNSGEIVLQDEDGDGAVETRVFRFVAQDYQGWVVWRSDSDDPDNMAMIGRFDKNNPETCIEGFCGDDNFRLLPNCFSERRAACFDRSTPGVIKFYDQDIYNGFSYFYAVTPFDYGDVSLVVDPVALASPMIFPARYPDDPNAEGEGNRKAIQVNLDAAAAIDGKEIYVYPNPLRRGSGIQGSEGEEVVWTNLPEESKIQVFSLAGDEIVELPTADRPQIGGNIYWITRNDDNKELASGIYIWRVVMPERGDFWGKLVIIR